MSRVENQLEGERGGQEPARRPLEQDKQMSRFGTEG